MNSPSTYSRLPALLIAAQFVSMWAAYFVLSASLGWAGLASATLLALAIPVGFGTHFGSAFTTSGIGWQFWPAALGVWSVGLPRPRRLSSAGTIAPLRRTSTAALTACLTAVLIAPMAYGQEVVPTRSTFAEVGIGLGKSEFYGRLEEGDEARDALGFSPNLGGTLSLAFYQRAGWASDRLYLGGRFKVQIATPTSGDGPEEYFFNHYYGGVSARVYPFSDQRTGPYAQADLTYGQFTEKLRDTSTDRADHQFAVGPGVLGAIGYALPVGGARRVNLQFYFQRNIGNGDVDGEGEVRFDYGALGAEIVLGF